MSPETVWESVRSALAASTKGVCKVSWGRLQPPRISQVGKVARNEKEREKAAECP